MFIFPNRCDPSLRVAPGFGDGLVVQGFGKFAVPCLEFLNRFEAKLKSFSLLLISVACADFA